ncbi:peptidase T [Bacillus altitudinis]|uniref:peptidase T n=1 Tax=Bacillus pumilus TaxID=1408 RepID=UPI0025A2FA88|nr:peptidase T [Bacillus pumilus]MDM5321948.1 peptidase T [Bacillus pumilus]MDR4994603.1 peptidase T [Bacillus altitudinis]
MKEEMIQRFTNYVQVDTQSDADKASCPSTEGQLNLARQLVEEMKSIGIQEVTMDENGYVMGTIPSNTDKDVPTIGFLAHIDTATDFTGKNVKPQLHENYQGSDITLNEDLHIVLSPTQFPNLQKYQGHTLITTDGTTLLGADNKAGIAEIMTAMHYLIEHPEIRHGKIRVAFTPDEEIGRGPHKFDVDAFGASYAYTIDGGPLGELQYESFNAAGAKVSIRGNNVHPGTAKDKMVSAAKIGMLFHNKLPSDESPEYTEGYEGFFHLTKFIGEVEEAELQYIIRDFDKDKFNDRKALFEKTANDLKAIYGENSINLKIQDQYYNMREKIEPVKHIVDIAHEAMENRSVTPVIEPIRGGTDGSQLSYKGLPTPNIFTGGENFHGKYEFISVENMVKAIEIIVEIARLFEEKA